MAELLHQFAVAQAIEGLFQLVGFRQRRSNLAEVPALHQGQAVLNHFAALPKADQALRSHTG
ncbi:hypothetical protein D3C81_2255420 [compost metagenome]